jgi:hypothetical protein
MTRSIIRAAACAAALALAACSATEGEAPALTGNENPDATVFLTQNQPPQAVMEALFEGVVVRDAQGCLRLGSDAGATVIWPYRFALQSRSDGLYVKDAGGRTVGRIGGSFRFGGGNIGAYSHAGLSAGDQARAASRCPGTFWLVGDTDLSR